MNLQGRLIFSDKLLKDNSFWLTLNAEDIPCRIFNAPFQESAECANMQ